MTVISNHIIFLHLKFKNTLNIGYYMYKHFIRGFTCYCNIRRSHDCDVYPLSIYKNTTLYSHCCLHFDTVDFVVHLYIFTFYIFHHRRNPPLFISLHLEV
jgi:hypothetical protein